VAPILRSASLDDVAAVLDLWRRAEAVVSVTDDVEGLRHLIVHDPAAVVVADEGGDLVGSVIAAWDGWRGSIYRLAVASTHRRRGLGRRLLAEAEGRLQRRGARRLQAVVVASEAAATGFWRAGPWEEQAGRLRFVRSP